MVGIDVVDMEIGRCRPRAARLGEDAAGDFRLTGETDDSLSAITAKLVFRRNNTAKRGRDRGAVALGQHGIGGRSSSVTRDQDRDLLR